MTTRIIAITLVLWSAACNDSREASCKGYRDALAGEPGSGPFDAKATLAESDRVRERADAVRPADEKLRSLAHRYADSWRAMGEARRAYEAESRPTSAEARALDQLNGELAKQAVATQAIMSEIDQYCEL